jgi:hypothetical protein
MQQMRKSGADTGSWASQVEDWGHDKDAVKLSACACASCDARTGNTTLG